MRDFSYVRALVGSDCLTGGSRTEKCGGTNVQLTVAEGAQNFRGKVGVISVGTPAWVSSLHVCWWIGLAF